MENASIKGIAVALAIHIAAFAGLIIVGASSEEETVSSGSDPILLMIAGDDPTKAAGLVNRDPGPARGTKEGKIFDPGEYTAERLKQIALENEKAAQKAEAEAAEEAREAEKEASEEKAPETTKGKEVTAKTVPAKSGGQERVSLSNILKNKASKNGGKSSGNTGKNSGKGKPGKSSISGASIDTGNIFGKPGGTGQNGGEGGSAIAGKDPRAEYVEAVALIFSNHLENVLAQNPISLPESVVVEVLFRVDGRGNITFYKIKGSSDPQVQDRVKKAFGRMPRQSPPPRGESFIGEIKRVVIRVD